MAEEVLDSASSAHSDGGSDFQDAADGSSPRPPLQDELEEAEEHPQPSNVDFTSATPAETKGKGKGVAALRDKIQNGNDVKKNKSSAGPGAQKDIVKQNRRKTKQFKPAEPLTSEREEATTQEDNSTSTTVMSKSAETKNEAPLSEAIEAIKLSDNEAAIPPSQGAQSMLDTHEMIKNPFGSLPSPAIGSNEESAEYAAQSSQYDHVDPKRFSSAPASQVSEIQLDTPTLSHANRFSTVSLSTPAQGDTKRDTFYAAVPTDSNTDMKAHTSSQEPLLSSLASQTEFLARQTERLSKVDGEKRSSLDGAARIKERVNELRYGHSRDGSSSSIPESNAVHANVDRQLEVVNISGEEEYSADGVAIQDGTIDWDFWGEVMSNYQEIARSQPRKLSRAIQAGIPGALRGMMWQLMSSSKDEEMEIIYAFYLKQNSSHEKMIRKDLARTFPGQEYFRDGKGIGQENLFNVVKAYSLYDEECGYCQGMQFVVGPLLLNMPDEEAFSTLVRLMKSYDLRGHFIPNMPALQLRLFQFDRLLEDTLPLLHRHLVRAGVKSSMYASGWFMTLFSYRSPLDICFRILDSVFAEGIEALFRFAMALMKKNEDALLNMSFEEAVPLLAARAFDAYKSGEEHEGDPSVQDEILGGGGRTEFSGQYRVNEFVRDAFEFKITPFLLDSYASDFADQVKVATAHRREMDEVKQQNKVLQAQVKDLEDQLGALQREHVDLVKNVVLAKLAKEEMEEELVTYKLKYAEATLLFDQSGVTPSSPRHLSVSSSATSINNDRRSS